MFLLAADDLLRQDLGQARNGEKSKEREKERKKERERERDRQTDKWKMLEIDFKNLEINIKNGSEIQI